MRVVQARSFRERLLGLMGRPKMDVDEGLWLIPCNGIHTFGMRFPIDVIVLDKGNQILRTEEAVRPNRVLMPVRGGHSVVELTAGAVKTAGLLVGDRLLFEEAGSEP